MQGNWVDSQSGLGILAAYPIAAVNELDLPPVLGDEDRKAQQAVVTLPSGGTILVTNTHLTHLNNTLGRKAQAEALAEMTAANKAHRYNIICGDFNCEANSVEIKSFIKKSGAIDCYMAGKGGEPRYSLANAFERNLYICVDHIFALPVPGSNTYPAFINSAGIKYP